MGIKRVAVFLMVGVGAFALADAAHGQAAGDPAPQLTTEALIGDSVSEPNSDRYSDVTEAIKRFKNRDQIGARTFLERAVTKDPKLPPLGVMIAKMQLLAGNSNAVRPALERAVQEDSADDPEPFLLLAEQALAGGRTIEADALFDKAVALIDSFDANAKRKRRFVIRAHRGRAVVAERRQKWEQAEADLRKWLEEEPDNVTARTRLGQALFMLEDDQAGYKEFLAAKRADDSLPNAFVSAATMYDRLGKTALAMRSFERAFESDADDETTLVAYAQALLKARDNEKAETVLQRARSVAPELSNVWLLSGVNARITGDDASARQYLQRAQNLAPSNRDVLNQLAQVLIDSEESADQQLAVQMAQMNAQLYPNNPDINITLAWVSFQTGQLAQANTALRKAIQGGSLTPDGSFLFAKMLVARNDKDNARALLESAMKDYQGLFVQRAEAEALLSTL